jgi:mxaJ protein
LHTSAQARERTLRVCADPVNLPFSDDRARGFENKIAELLAKELSAELSYTWRAQRRGFLRNTLNAGTCDVVIGVPVGLDAVRTTAPYYRSTFAFVVRKGSRFVGLSSVADERLREAKIGVPLAGDDGANPAPVMALSRRGITQNLVGFSLWDEYRREIPKAVEAVARGDIDVAILWGPVAGAAHKVPGLVVSPMRDESDGPIPFAFSIAMGVRPADLALKSELDSVLARKRAAINAILRAYHIPLLPMTKEPSK